jgi:hypothetical protein
MLFACVGHVVTDDDFTPMMEAEADGDGYISLPEFTLAVFFNDIVKEGLCCEFGIFDADGDDTFSAIKIYHSGLSEIPTTLPQSG